MDPVVFVAFMVLLSCAVQMPWPPSPKDTPPYKDITANDDGWSVDEAPLLQVAISQTRGYAVFATQAIQPGTVLLTSPAADWEKLSPHTPLLQQIYGACSDCAF